MLLKLLRSMLQPAGRAAPAHGALSATPIPLSPGFTPSGRCKICGGPAYLFDVVDFNKHAAADPYQFGLAGVPVYYSRCLDCGFVFTNHFDDWDRERFARLVYNDDYGKVDPEYTSARPLRVADYFAHHWPAERDATILDYGSGSGVFARRLKSLGYANVAIYDPFSHPSRPDGTFDLITCTEVMEHAPDPHATVRDMLGFAHADSVLLFTTLVQPDDIERDRANWWYIGPRNGHVAIYSDGALDALAAAHGRWYLPGDTFHAFTPRLDTAVLGAYRPRFAATIYAPADDAPGWHGVEDHLRGEIRWTARSRIPLPFTPPSFPCSVHVRLPIVMEAAPGFALQCALEYGDARCGVTATRLAHWKGLIATLDLAEPGGELALVTPEPVAREADPRPVGLAVPLRIGEERDVVAWRS